MCSKLLFFAVGVIFAGITDFRSDAFQRKYKPKIGDVRKNTYELIICMN